MGINTIYVGPAAQQPFSPKEAEEERRTIDRRRSKRVSPKKQQTLWTPNNQVGVNSNISVNLQDFAKDNPLLFQSAIRIAQFALEQRISDVTMRLPISIGIAADPKAASAIVGGDDEGLYLFIQVHLDHDLFGVGSVRIISDEEFEIIFSGGKSLPRFYGVTEQDTLAFIGSLGDQRSHDLDTLREFIADDVKDSDLTEIDDRLSRMLDDYHEATDTLANDLIVMLAQKGATYETEYCGGKLPGGGYEMVMEPEIRHTPVLNSTPGIRNMLSQKAFKIDGAGDNDEVYPLLNEYRAADYQKGAYLVRAIRDLTLCGITVSTERTYGGNHTSKAQIMSEGKLPVVDVPALGYAVKMTTNFTPDSEPEVKPES